MTGEQKDRTYPLNRIYLYLTGGCNLRCRHCWIAPKYQGGNETYPYLSFELFRSIIEQARPLGLSAVKLTGGEPLLHPQIHEILKQVRANDLELVVETNGLLCKKGLAREMAACKDPSVAVSLDGSDAETHEWLRGVPGCFEEAKAGIRNLVKAGLNPQIIMTMTRRNKNQLEDVVRLAETLGAGSVKFNVMQPTSRGRQMHKSGEALGVEEIVEIGHWVENTLSASTNLALFFDHALAFRALGDILSGNDGGCAVCGIMGVLGVLADGSYALCGIGETVPELVFGHAAKDSLEDVWNNAPVLRQLRDGLPVRLEGICGECLLKGLCLGGCIAQNYYRDNNLWAPFWLCEEARRLGLFPETRLRPEA